MKKIRTRKILSVCAMILFLCLLTACGSENSSEKASSAAAVTSQGDTAEVSDPETAVGSSDEADPGWIQITQEEAARIMAEETGYLIVDVRRQDEYAESHIPGAICIPNESIGTDEIPELPDKDQTLLIYCRSGRRSKEASEKLAQLGYTDVREFGGIIDWTGEIVTEESANDTASADV